MASVPVVCFGARSVRSSASHPSSSRDARDACATVPTRARVRASARLGRPPPAAGVATSNAAAAGRRDCQARAVTDRAETEGQAEEGSSLEVAPEAAGWRAASGRVAPPVSRTDGMLTNEERRKVENAWTKLMRWSRIRLTKTSPDDAEIREQATKVCVLGGGAFGTAMAAILARNKPDREVVLLVRNDEVVESINSSHRNSRYFPDKDLPVNLVATTEAESALEGAKYVIHAIPVQYSRAYLENIKHLLSPDVPMFLLSKGLEVGTGHMMTEVIEHALGRKQPLVVLSGPSFAIELMEGLPTMLVAASEYPGLAAHAVSLLASPCLRVNISDDVIGVEIAGALKNVLAIAAGVVEGLNLGNNALAAVTSQGVMEIRWLAEKMGAKPATMSGPAGVGDIMLTCFVNLSRNRTVGVRLGAGEPLEVILGSGKGVAEGVATAGVVIGLADRYSVSLPVLTAVSRILDNQMSPICAVQAIMDMPQVPEV